MENILQLDINIYGAAGMTAGFWWAFRPKLVPLMLLGAASYYLLQKVNPPSARNKDGTGLEARPEEAKQNLPPLKRGRDTWKYMGRDRGTSKFLPK